MSNENSHDEFETVVFGSGTSPQSGSGMSMPEEVLSVGDILCETYILRARLGRGGMGEVWKADEVYEGEILRTVVIKTLAPNVPNVQEEMARIQSMFHKIHSLQHQHICPMYAMKNDPKAGTIIVMKYIDGMMLQEYYAQYMRANNEFPVSEVVRLLLPIAQALDYSHSKSVLHRDVKPQNILVSNDKSDGVQLIDFGLVMEMRSSIAGRGMAQQFDTSGTLPYMSPEQWSGEFQDARSDQFSLAVVVYELLAGHLPFTGANMQLLGFQILNKSPEPIIGVPDHVNFALQRALSKNRKLRFESCEDFIRALEDQKLTQDVMSQAEIQAAEEQKSQAKRSTKLIPWILGGSLALVFVLIIGIFLLVRREEKQIAQLIPQMNQQTQQAAPSQTIDANSQFARHWDKMIENQYGKENSGAANQNTAESKKEETPASQTPEPVQTSKGIETPEATGTPGTTEPPEATETPEATAPKTETTEEPQTKPESGNESAPADQTGVKSEPEASSEEKPAAAPEAQSEEKPAAAPEVKKESENQAKPEEEAPAAEEDPIAKMKDKEILKKALEAKKNGNLEEAFQYFSHYPLELLKPKDKKEILDAKDKKELLNEEKTKKENLKQYGDVCTQLGRNESAMKIRKIQMTDNPLPDDVLEYTFDAIEMKDYKTAIDWCDEVLVNEPENYDILRQKLIAMIYYAAEVGDLGIARKALELANQLVEVQKDADSDANRGLVYLKDQPAFERAYDFAKKYFIAALKTDPNNKLALLYQGILYRDVFYSNNKLAAENNFQKVIDLIDQDIDSLDKEAENKELGLVNASLESQRTELRSKKPYLLSLKAESLLQLFILLQKDKRTSEALDCLTKYLELKPERWDVYEQRGDLYFNMGKNQEALEDYNICLENTSENYAVLHQRAKVKIRMKQWKDAKDDVDFLIDHDQIPEKQADYYETLSKIYDGAGKKRQADEAISKARRIRAKLL